MESHDDNDNSALQRMNMFLLNYEPCKVKKCDKTSKEAREKGNFYYKNQNWNEALTFYNAAINFAKSNEVRSLSFGNRSAVYLELKRFEDCLKNIQWARENNFPKDSLSRLDEREETCRMMKTKLGEKVNNDTAEYFKLSYPSNKKVPWVANCIEVRYTRKYGRGVYATRNLKAGNIISSEDILIPFLHKFGRFRHCYNCFKSNYLNLIPCDKTAAYMFCSTTCKDQFYAKIENLNEIISPEKRIESEVTSVLGESVKMMRRACVPKKTIFDYDFSDVNNPKYKENLMMCLLSLYAAPAFEEVKDIRFDLYALSLFKLNNKHCRMYCQTKESLEGKNITLFASLINHSCAPNANLLTVDNKVVTYITRPIKKGEQIFIAYNETDKEHMMQIHCFKCDCELCRGKISCMKMMLDKEALMHCYQGDVDSAKEYLKEKWGMINNNLIIKSCISSFLDTCEFVMKFLAAFNTFPAVALSEI